MKILSGFLKSSFLFLFFSLPSIAQPNGEINCKVTDEGKKPMAFAAVTLLNPKDSALIKAAVTDDKGVASIGSVADGQYLVSVYMVGYAGYISSLLTVNPDNHILDIGVIELRTSSVSLNEVQVVYKRPFIEAQADKIVVNVANSTINAGSTVLEVLQKSPGIFVDNSDNISMRGKQGLVVMIDDKAVILSGSDLGNMLRGMSSESIEKIELITNPSAKYDAEGKAGIINIKTKKDKRFGTNGSLSASYGQGKYPKSNIGFNMNSRSKSFNVFGGYNYGYRKGFSDLHLGRKFYAAGLFDGAYLQDNLFTGTYSTHSAKAGADWYISYKTVAGIVVSGMHVGNQTTGSDYSRVFNNQNEYSSFFTTSNLSETEFSNYSVNGNFKTNIDSLGQQLTADIDYARYDNISIQDFTTRYFNLSGSERMPAYLLHGNIRGTLDIKSFKADYVLPLKNKNKVEAGVKASVVHADNDLGFFSRGIVGDVYDSSKSNHFIYMENINAGYVNFSKSGDVWSCQLGLRAEQTVAKGEQVVFNNSFDNSYIELFPSLSVQKNISQMNQLGFTLSRRIDRPDYRQLNPFKFFLDPSTYSEGNPYLRPQLTWSFELSDTYNQRMVTTLAYSRTTDNITEVLAPSTTENKIAIQSTANLASFDYYGLSVSLPVSPAKWWETQINVNIYYGHYEGDIANTSLSNGNLTFNINSNNTFTLPGSMSAELGINYRAREVYGYMTVEPVTDVSVGLQKSFFKKEVNVKLNVNDVFHSANDVANTHFNTYDENFNVKRDSRFATLALTYRFGNGSITPRRKTGGADEEKNRANSGG